MTNHWNDVAKIQMELFEENGVKLTDNCGNCKHREDFSFGEGSCAFLRKKLVNRLIALGLYRVHNYDVDVDTTDVCDNYERG